MSQLEAMLNPPTWNYRFPSSSSNDSGAMGELKIFLERFIFETVI
jgi:hypothetical protein